LIAYVQLIARDVTRSVVCVSVGRTDVVAYCAKTAEAIEMPFGGLTVVGSRNHVLDGVKIGRIHS